MVNVSLLWLLLVPVFLSVALFFILRSGIANPPVKQYRYGRVGALTSNHPPPITFAAISLLIGVIITAITFASGVGFKTHDYEVLNGQVTGKSREEVHCRHSYSCNCRKVCSGSGKDKSCREECDTCYEHSYDVDWIAHTTLGGIYIDTIDRRGIEQPPRWTAVTPGQPASKVSSYTNYIKAVPESVMHFASNDLKAKFVGKVPAYPLNIYDYHYIDRVIPVGVNVPDIKRWNLEIGGMLRTLGPSKQVNVVIIPTNITDKDYIYAVRDAWLGGKKNDVVIIASITDYPKINWVHVMSWSDRELFKVQLRDELQGGDFTVERVIPIIEKNIAKTFERKRMREFEYLENEIDPPDWLLWTGVVLNILVCGGMIILYRKGGW